MHENGDVAADLWVATDGPLCVRCGLGFNYHDEHGQIEDVRYGEYVAGLLCAKFAPMRCQSPHCDDGLIRGSSVGCAVCAPERIAGLMCPPRRAPGELQ